VVTPQSLPPPNPGAFPASGFPPPSIRNLAGGAAIGAGLDFGLRLMSGQPPDQAAAGALASGLGSLAGGAIGAAVGGVPGAWLGSMIGGAVGGALYDRFRPETNDAMQRRLQEEEYDVQTTPPGVPNILHYKYTWQAAEVFDASSQIGLGVSRIVGLGSESYEPVKGEIWRRLIIKYKPFTGSWNNYGQEIDEVLTTYALNTPVDDKHSDFRIYSGLSIKSLDGKAYPWNSAKDNLDSSYLGQDRRSPESQNSPYGALGIGPLPYGGGHWQPGRNNNLPSTGNPQGQRLPTPQINNPPEISNQRQHQPTPTPLEQPQFQQQRQNQQQQQHGGYQFSGQGGLQSPGQMFLPSTGIPYIPGSQVFRFSIPTYNPNTPQQNPQPQTNQQQQIQDFRQPQTQKAEPIPDSQKPPKPPESTPQEQGQKSIEQLQTEVMRLGAGMAAITLLLKGLDSKVDKLPEENCRRCVKPQMDNLLDRLIQAADLSLLGVINNKLGPQLPGGISSVLDKAGKLVGKTWDFLQIDRVLNVLTFATALHNAYMLSNGLTQTLFSAISNILDVFGIEDKDGNALDVGQIVTQWTDTFFKKLFGVETVDGIKKEWAKLNRIYQAASNIIWSMQSIFDSTRSLLDLAIENTGKIGNALRKAGVVFENAYGKLTEKMTARNKWQKALDEFAENAQNIENVISTVDEAAQEVLSIQDTVKQLKDQQKEAKDSIQAFVSSAEETEKKEKEASKAPQL
jgi:hypothetical protein